MQYKDKGLLRGVGTVCVLIFFLLPFGARAQKATVQESFVFSFPSIPDSLTTVGGRAAYLVSHYWDRASFPAALSSVDNDSIEQAWVNYCDLFALTDAAVVGRSLSGLTASEAISPSAGIFLMSLAEKYLFDTGSPYCNDAAYLAALNAFTSRHDVDTLYQLRYASQLRMLSHCRVGGTAADFGFVSDSGAASSLYQLSAPRLLLLLYDPECDHCRLVMGWLERSPRIASLLSSGRLFILSVNVGDVDSSAARYGHRPNWTDTHDHNHSIIANSLYDLRTQPLCLLLDADKKVIAKMTSVSDLEQQLASLL